MRRMLCGLALLALGARPAAAQEIWGRVIETRTGWPVPNATVTVVDAGGRLVAYAQTDAQGDYLVDLREAGQFVLRAERVGYRPRSTALTDVREGRRVRRDIRLTRGTRRLGDEGERGVLPPGALPQPIPGVPYPVPAVPPSTDDGTSTSRAPAGDATAARPVPRAAPAAEPRREGERRQPRPSSRPAQGGDRGGAKRTP